MCSGTSHEDVLNGGGHLVPCGINDFGAEIRLALHQWVAQLWLEGYDRANFVGQRSVSAREVARRAVRRIALVGGMELFGTTQGKAACGVPSAGSGSGAASVGPWQHLHHLVDGVFGHFSIRSELAAVDAEHACGAGGHLVLS